MTAIISTQEREARRWVGVEADRLGVSSDELLSAIQRRGWLLHQIKALEPDDVHLLSKKAPLDPKYAAKIRSLCAENLRGLP